MKRELTRLLIALVAGGTLLLLAFWFGLTSVASGAPLCTEKGWYFGVVYANGDSIKVAGHGPLRAWSKQALVLPGGENKIVVNTTDMWSALYSRVNVTFYRMVERGYEPHWEEEGTYQLQRHSLACQWLSETDEKGVQWSFGNLRALASASHPNHRELMTFETLWPPEFDDWR